MAFRALQTVALLFNLGWFGSGYWFFSLITEKAAYSLRRDIPRGDRRLQLVVPTMKFLGGFNLAFCLLSAIKLLRHLHTFLSRRKTKLENRIALDQPSDGKSDLDTFIASAVAHATQFLFNVPHIGGIKTGAPWDVLKGQMFFIFTMDFLGAVLNSAAGLAVISSKP
ncbi:hypothetical protein AAMO2058_000160600 [Amorphochlora amoebiformis]